MVAEAASTARRQKRVPVGSPGLAAFAAFVSVLDDELRRSHRFEQEMGVVWLWASNWEQASARWSLPQASRALEGIAQIARGDVRGDDRISLAPLGSLPDLHVLVSLPHTGEVGRIVQERLLRDLRSAQGFEEAGSIEWRSALAVLPRDGQSADGLFESLAQNLASQASSQA